MAKMRAISSFLLLNRGAMAEAADADIALRLDFFAELQAVGSKFDTVGTSSRRTRLFIKANEYNRTFLVT